MQPKCLHLQPYTMTSAIILLVPTLLRRVPFFFTFKTSPNSSNPNQTNQNESWLLPSTEKPKVDAVLLSHPRQWENYCISIKKLLVLFDLPLSGLHTSMCWILSIFLEHNRNGLKKCSHRLFQVRDHKCFRAPSANLSLLVERYHKFTLIDMWCATFALVSLSE